MASTDEHNSDKKTQQLTPYSLSSTVTKNKEFYTCANIEGADRARIYKGLLGWTGKNAFKTYVSKNILLNCNINVYGINTAENIYGDTTTILQGKMRRKKPTVH